MSSARDWMGGCIGRELNNMAPLQHRDGVQMTSPVQVGSSGVPDILVSFFHNGRRRRHVVQLSLCHYFYIIASLSGYSSVLCSDLKL